MTELTLDLSRKIVDTALAFAREKSLNPLAVVVLDARGALRAAAAEDGSSLARWKIAFGKANGALALGVGSRKLAAMATERAHFFVGLSPVLDGGIVTVPGGVLVRSAAGGLIGAAGASGDTSDNDEAALIHAIRAAGLVADAG
ncbi:MAG: GlcG/HbpS family heme-binding protein [Beijerinckiaceae bacterium]